MKEITAPHDSVAQKIRTAAGIARFSRNAPRDGTTGCGGYRISSAITTVHSTSAAETVNTVGKPWLSSRASPSAGPTAIPRVLVMPK